MYVVARFPKSARPTDFPVFNGELPDSVEFVSSDMAFTDTPTHAYGIHRGSSVRDETADYLKGQGYMIGLVHWNEGAPSHLKAVSGSWITDTGMAPGLEEKLNRLKYGN